MKKDDLFATKLGLFRCDCMTGGIVVMRLDDEFNEYEGAPFIELAFWCYGQTNIPAWKYKLRCIWHILKKGTPYTDMVWMRKEQAEALANEILKKCCREKEKKCGRA